MTSKPDQDNELIWPGKTRAGEADFVKKIRKKLMKPEREMHNLN